MLKNNKVKIILYLIMTMGLTISLYSIGFLACCLPITTQALSAAFSGTTNPSTPFTAEQLQYIAGETADYTLFSHDKAKLQEALLTINKEAETPSAQTEASAITAVDETYTLDKNSLSHLDDVYEVLHGPIPLILAVVVIITGLLVYGVYRTLDKKIFGILITASGAADVILGFIAALFALGDFSDFFNTFHSFFFNEGTWLFSSDSLLITMYPTPFWVGMGIVWLTTTFVLCLTMIVAGCTILMRAIRQTDTTAKKTVTHPAC